MTKGVYTVPTVCERGHLLSVERIDEPFCSDCGAPTLSTCPSCGTPLLGLPVDSADSWGNFPAESWERPRFCSKCGAAFPWLDRQGRIYELQNLLSREQLDPGTALALREELEALADPDLPEAEQVKRWKRIRTLSPSLMESGRKIITDLVTEAAKKELGLDLRGLSLSVGTRQVGVEQGPRLSPTRTLTPPSAARYCAGDVAGERS